MSRKDVRTISKFDQLVNDNKKAGKHWHHGLKSKLHDMSESEARTYILRLEEDEKKLADKIVLASTWNINCGIATYTRYLLDNLDKIIPNLFKVNPIDRGELKYRSGKLTHLQHEFGIVPEPPKITNRLIITWHTVSRHTEEAIKNYESKYEVLAHIVHSEKEREKINSSKDVWIVPHGSMLIPEMKKEYAKRLLGLNTNKPIGFVFGFQSGDKNYKRLMDAAKNTDIYLVISGAPHNLVNSVNIPNNKNVTFINRFLVENEVNLYASASDLLLFDYASKEHYSVSGALHRVIGAGRPVICSDVNHFNDIKHGSDCLKFKNQDGLERCIKMALKDNEKLSIAARNYAENTSWEKVARRHIDIYKKYENIIIK